MNFASMCFPQKILSQARIATSLKCETFHHPPQYDPTMLMVGDGKTKEVDWRVSISMQILQEPQSSLKMWNFSSPSSIWSNAVDGGVEDKREFSISMQILRGAQSSLIAIFPRPRSPHLFIIILNVVILIVLVVWLWSILKTQLSLWIMNFFQTLFLTYLSMHAPATFIIISTRGLVPLVIDQTYLAWTSFHGKEGRAPAAPPN